MRYKTKRKRLMAIADTYCKLHKKTSFTTDEVAEWALAQSLWPVPKRGDPAVICLAWERQLERAKTTAEVGDG